MNIASLAFDIYEENQKLLDIIAEQSREIAQLKAKLEKYEGIVVSANGSQNI